MCVLSAFLISFFYCLLLHLNSKYNCYKPHDLLTYTKSTKKGDIFLFFLFIQVCHVSLLSLISIIDHVM